MSTPLAEEEKSDRLNTLNIIDHTIFDGTTIRTITFCGALLIRNRVEYQNIRVNVTKIVHRHRADVSRYLITVPSI